MRNAIISMFAVTLLGLTPQAHGQASDEACTQVSVEDATASTAPLNLSGVLSLCERVDGPRDLVYWYKGELTARNDSGKALIAIVVIVDLAFPRTEKGLQRFQFDDFFRPAVLVSGWSRALDVESGVMKVPLPMAAHVTPSAKGRVAFAQFEDGTFFGDPMFAADLFDIRGRLVLALRAADSAYRDGGEQAFSVSLQQKTGRSEADAFLRNLASDLQRNAGGGARVARRIQAALRIAASRSPLASP